MVSAVLSTSEGRYAVLEADLPEAGTVAIGVLLQDPASDKLHLRLRRDWDDVAGEDAEVFEALEDDLSAKAAEWGAEKLFAWLEDTLSNTVRITDRESVLVRDFDRTLNRLYSRHVQSTVSRQTHIPRWTLRVAAGHFLDNAEVEPEGYEEAPSEIRRVTDDMFAAEIVGASMEPVIPNGSVCLFRKFGAGSRQGKLVLVEQLGRGGNDRYTVKRYVSYKRQREDGTWEHNAIRLEPLNPEHDAWYLDLEEERYRIVAEFVRVLY
jgi:SOS-response transcriptional repressor LexA